jgi:3-deoxy-D-manno-octulosonate 8-phosphate phosphatase (KDO 8-P phosphatase)
MSFVIQGHEKKVQAFADVLAQAGVTNAEVAYIGDDLNDIPLMVQSGLGIAVADAAPETLAHAHYVTTAPGGFGAVREVIELILKSQGRWDDLVASFSTAD